MEMIDFSQEYAYIYINIYHFTTHKEKILGVTLQYNKGKIKFLQEDYCKVSPKFFSHLFF